MDTPLKQYKTYFKSSSAILNKPRRLLISISIIITDIDITIDATSRYL